MSEADQIVCKATSWFTVRAGAMLVMFSVFSVLFFVDGTTGYREKNLEYYLNKTFQKATTKFSQMSSDGSLSPEDWKEFTERQTVDFPSDPKLLPEGTDPQMKWPAILRDYDKVRPLQHNILWQEFSRVNRMSSKVVEHPFDAGKIRAQMVVFYICIALVLATLFFLIRTLRRSTIANRDALITANGRCIPYSDMKTLDLRKWDTKGIAMIDFDGLSGKGRAKIDGLTYGGFKAEHGAPAEQLMKKIRENFTGEIIEYTTNTSEREQKTPTESA